MLDRSEALRALIISELDEIKDPCSVAAGTPFGLSEMGLVDEITISDTGDVLVKLRLTSPFCHMIGFFKQEATRRIETLAGINSVELFADNGLDWSPSRISASAIAKRESHLMRMDASAA